MAWGSKASVLAVVVMLVSPLIWDAPVSGQGTSLAQRIEAARREGALTVYGNNLTTETFDMLAASFKRKYDLPNHRMNFQQIKSGELIAKIDQEIAAGRVTGDAVQLSALEWYYFKLIPAGKLMKYESPEYRFYDKSREAGGYEPGYWAGNLYAFTIAYNTKMVKEIKHWKDLLDPALKGKVNIGDASKSATYLATYIGLRKFLGVDFFQKLAAQKPVFVVSGDQLGQMIADGEYPVGTTIVARVVDGLRKQGAPMKMVYPEEGVVLLPLPFILLADAPHPESAKLWIDYVHSREGQLLMTRGDKLFSGRSDVPVPDLELLPDLSRIKIIRLDYKKELTPENTAKYRKEWESIFMR